MSIQPTIASAERANAIHEKRSPEACNVTSDTETIAQSKVASRHAPWLLERLVAVLTYDFCPSANRFLRWLKHPIGFLGIAGLVAATFALFLNSFAWVAFGAIVVILTLGFAWPWLGLRGLDARLSWEEKRCSEGDQVKVRLRIRNRCPWPVWGLSVKGGFRQDAPSAALARVAGLSKVEFSWDFVPDERGVYPVAPPYIQTGFPFGLWTSQCSISVEEEFLVWPKTVRLNGLPDLTSSQSSEEHLSDRKAGDLGDILGTRSFRQGDSLRRVHWAQSARHQRLVVTERQSGVESRVCVRIDASNESHLGSGKDSTLNWTLRIAASICQALNDEHTHVDCVIGDDVICLSQTGGLRRLMDCLARIPESGHTGGATAIRSRHYDGGEIVCTTDRRRQEVAAGSRLKRGPREVVIAAESAGDDSSATLSSMGRPWLFIPSTNAASTEFPLQWQRACRIA